jgi:hypothetical protein
MASEVLTGGAKRRRKVKRTRTQKEEEMALYADAKAPLNLMRYCEKNDELLWEWGKSFGLDRVFIYVGFTILRPTDAILKEQMKKMEELAKKGKGPEGDMEDPAFLTLQREALAYCVKGVITPDNMRPRHVYVTMAEHAYAVYLEGSGPNVYICDELTDDASAQKKCPVAKHVVTAQNGSNIYSLGGAIGKGFKPLEHPPRTTIQSEENFNDADSMDASKKKGKKTSKIGGRRIKRRLPHLRKKHRRLRKFMIGGGGASAEVQLCSCEIEGGGKEFEPGSRKEIKAQFQAAYHNKWPKAFVQSFYGYLNSGHCKEAESNPGMKAAFDAMLTGNYSVDAERVLEQNSDRAERDVLNLQPDPVIDGFFENWSTDSSNAESYRKAWKKRFNGVLMGGAKRPFTKARRRKASELNAIIKAGYGAVNDAVMSGLSENSMAGVETAINKAVGAIESTYAEIAEHNSLDGAQAFSPDAHHYLKKRFGKKLGHYLAHAALRFALNEEMDGRGVDPDMKEDYFEHALPGLDHKGEFESVFQGGDSAVDAVTRFALLGRAVTGGHFPYVRADMEAFSGELNPNANANGSMVGGGHGDSPTAMAEIDMAYRPFDAYSLALMDDYGAEAVSAMTGGGKKRGKGKKIKISKKTGLPKTRLHKLRKRRRRHAEGFEDADKPVDDDDASSDDEISGKKIKLGSLEYLDSMGAMGRKKKKKLIHTAKKLHRRRKKAHKLKKHADPEYAERKKKHAAEAGYALRKAKKHIAKRLKKYVKKHAKRKARKVKRASAAWAEAHAKKKADAAYAARHAKKKAKHVARKSKKTARKQRKKAHKKAQPWYEAYKAAKMAEAEYAAYRKKKAKRRVKKVARKAKKGHKRHEDGVETAPTTTPAPQPEDEDKKKKKPEEKDKDKKKPETETPPTTTTTTTTTTPPTQEYRKKSSVSLDDILK